MSSQHPAPWSRREFLGRLTLAGTAGVLGLHSRPVAAEPPPETTRLRLEQIEGICIAPQYVAEELLQAEGFLDVHAVKTNTVRDIEVALASGDAHLGTWRAEMRNIYEDYKRAFGEEPVRIRSVGIMTDTDNTGEDAEAFYGDIAFLRRRPQD